MKIFGLNALPDRALPAASPTTSTRPTAGSPLRRAGWGGAAHRDRHDRLLRRLRLHRLAHAARRVHDRRPHVPRRLVPAPAQPARGPADRASRRWPGRRSISTTCSRSSRSSRRSCRRRIRVPFPAPIRAGLRVRGRRLPLSRAPSAGRCAISSFTLQAGEVLALVGENGAGKTTLVKLLARLYDPDEGRILLDGHDLRDYDLDALRGEHRRHLPGLRALPPHRRRQHRRRPHRGARRPRAHRRTPRSAAWPTR